MAERTFWPEQIGYGIYTLEQVKALSSAVRAEVYWSFAAEQPMSTLEIAQMLKRSPSTVRYHANELIKVGLLIAVETRKRRSRTEEAYVHKIVEAFTAKAPWEPEYMEEVNRGFDSILRGMSRERRLGYEVSNLDPDFYNNIFYNRYTVRLSPTNLAKLRKKLREIMVEFDQLDDPKGLRIQYSSYVCPDRSESMARYRELTGKEWGGDTTMDEPED
jgi:predicted transcriptional regulator